MNGIGLKALSMGLLAVLLALALSSTCYLLELRVNPVLNSSIDDAGLKRFSSLEELEAFLKANTGLLVRWSDIGLARALTATAKAEATSPTPPTYSTTNVQVEGVDEADIVKTDGTYIYLASDDRVIIVKAYPPEEAEILSEIRVNGSVIGLFINDDRMAVFVRPVLRRIDRREFIPPKPVTAETVVEVYDLSNRTGPRFVRSVHVEGWYLSSRMIGDYVYLVVNSPAVKPGEELKVVLPSLSVNRGGFTVWRREVKAYEVYYADVPSYYGFFTTIVALNLKNDLEEPVYKTILTGPATCMYVSQRNIYLAIRVYPTIKPEASDRHLETTAIYKIRINGREIECDASGEVPGFVLNQFSMDEYGGFFRIATTTGRLARLAREATSVNHVYVLNMSLSIVGRLENLAPGERIYSARFMGDRCYLVTFRKVDPLFVVDLSDPREPKVLGKLKIPGYSDYLHPYDENYLIGIGKETIPAEEGDFSWFQGVKISLFDVSDVEKPKELSKYIIGDRGTETPVLRDHKALLFDKARSLLIIPVLVAEIDREKTPNPPPYAYGEFTFQGAYVFKITPEEGIVLRGRITHMEGVDHLTKSGFYMVSPYMVKRSLYISDVLYTISNGKIEMHNIETLEPLGELKIP